MKQLLILLITVPFLVGCGGTSINENIADLSKADISNTEPVIQEGKPRIPSAAANESTSETTEDEAKEIDDLLKQIEEKINQPNILYEDIKRGWYYGGLDEKKYGTPETWVWIKEGNNSRWVSPNAVEETHIVKDETLCKKTAGTYVVSCVETEIESCEHIPANECRCVMGSKWHDTQGCVLTRYSEETESDEYIEISRDELSQGQYTGLPNQKKLNTPLNWVWIDNGKNSRWQNPN